MRALNYEGFLSTLLVTTCSGGFG